MVGVRGFTIFNWDLHIAPVLPSLRRPTFPPESHLGFSSGNPPSTAQAKRRLMGRRPEDPGRAVVEGPGTLQGPFSPLFLRVFSDRRIE